MATSLSLENDPSLAQGYIKVNGTTAATITTSGITANLTGNATTATKLSTTTGSAPAYACRAWVNFAGNRDTTGAVSTANTNRLIRSSGNITSVLRTGIGTYSIAFTTPMSDSNYSIGACGDNIPSSFVDIVSSVLRGNSTTICYIATSNSAETLIDPDSISIQIFGN